MSRGMLRRAVPTRTLHRGGTWNVRKGRNPRRVAAEVVGLIEYGFLDWLTLQEAADYVDELRDQLDRLGYDVLAGRGSRSRRDSVLIVSRELAPRHKRVHRLHRLGWERAADNRHKGLHPPRHMTTARVGVGWSYRLGSAHLAPTPAAPNLPLRRRAHRRGAATIARLCRLWIARGSQFVLPGDYNAPARSEYVKQLRRVGMLRSVGGIDYVLRSRGVLVMDMRRVVFGTSDHDPVLFLVRKIERA